MSTGASKGEVGPAMGRFEFMPDVEKEGSPVYRQAHSREIPMDVGEIVLYRWEKSSFDKTYLIFPTPDVGTSGLLGQRRTMLLP